MQWLNLIFYITPNICVLLKPVQIYGALVYYSEFIRWSCWNAVRPPSIMPAVAALPLANALAYTTCHMPDADAGDEWEAIKGRPQHKSIYTRELGHKHM